MIWVDNLLVMKNTFGKKGSLGFKKLSARYKAGELRKKTLDVKNLVVASSSLINMLENSDNLPEALNTTFRKNRAIISKNTLRLKITTSNSSDVKSNTVHMLNSKHIITELPQQADSYTKFSVIRKFMSNGFDGEIIHQSDQQIIDQFKAIPDNEKEDEIKKLKQLAFRFGA